MTRPVTRRRRATTALVALAALLTTGFAAAPRANPGAAPDATTAAADAPDTSGDAPRVVARDAEPVVLTGAQLPGWSRSPATGQPAPFPAGGSDDNPLGDEVRSAHHGTLVVPDDPREGAPVDEIVGYRWDGDWKEIPVQVDERFPHFLANGRADFGWYSYTDTELTYAWGPTETTVGEEAWKKVAGTCRARYPETVAEARALADPDRPGGPVITPGAGERPADYLGPMADPVAGLDDDDEVAFLAADAGAPAPPDAPPPPGATPGSRRQVLLADPLDPATTRAVYLFRSEAGPSFDHTDGHVTFERPDGLWGADRWVDRHLWDADDPEKLGSSNRGYGPNLPGPVCVEADTDGDGEPDTLVERTSGGDDGRGGSADRFPLDRTEVRTDRYRWTASGRWMIRGVQVARPDQDAVGPGRGPRGRGRGADHGRGRGLDKTVYGPDLVDRWKGRAFQQSPDSEISLVGFEDEQVNWEANSALLGWRAGPVRAIRATWGADSGTNVTKTETFYRDAVQYRYRVRVHPIPPDGLYTSWDYNHDVAARYYNALRPEGVAADGENDDVGQVDEVAGNPAFFDAPDPTFDLVSALYRWEQVSGRGDAGSLVYTFDLTGPTTATNPLVVPYYRDDACFDDGTGDDPVPRVLPGDDGQSEQVRRAYAEQAGKDYDAGERADCRQLEKQGAFASHGLHFLVTGDSDNGFVGTPVPVNEIDGRQWQFAVPTREPTNVGRAYGNVVRAPLVPVVTSGG